MTHTIYVLKTVLWGYYGDRAFFTAKNLSARYYIRDKDEKRIVDGASCSWDVLPYWLKNTILEHNIEKYKLITGYPPEFKKAQPPLFNLASIIDIPPFGEKVYSLDESEMNSLRKTLKLSLEELTKFYDLARSREISADWWSK